TRREGAQLAIHALVVTTEAVAGPARQAVSGRDAHLAAQRQVGGRGTEEIAGFQLQGRWCIEVDRAGSGKRRLEVHPLGQEVLDQHGAGREGRRLGIDERLDTPRSAWDAGSQGEAYCVTAGLAVTGKDLAVLNTVGAQEAHAERQPGDGLGLRVTRQDREVDGLTRAVGAAVRGEVDGDGSGRYASFDSAVTEVELWRLQRQDDEVVGALVQQHGGSGVTG